MGGESGDMENFDLDPSKINLDLKVPDFVNDGIDTVTGWKDAVWAPAKAGGKIVETGGEAVLALGDVANEGLRAFSLVLREMMGMIKSGAGWGSEAMTNTLEKLEDVYDEYFVHLDEPTHVPEADAFKDNKYAYYSYLEAHYETMLVGPEKELKDAEKVLKRLKQEEKRAYVDMRDSDEASEATKEELDHITMLRDQNLEEWGNTWQQLDGSPKYDEDGVKVYTPPKNPDVPTVKSIGRELKKSQKKIRNAESRIDKLPAKLDKELNASRYTNRIRLSLPDTVDVLQKYVDNLRGKVGKIKGNYDSSVYWKKVTGKKMSETYKKALVNANTIDKAIEIYDPKSQQHREAKAVKPNFDDQVNLLKKAGRTSLLYEKKAKRTALKNAIKRLDEEILALEEEKASPDAREIDNVYIDSQIKDLKARNKKYKSILTRLEKKIKDKEKEQEGAADEDIEKEKARAKTRNKETT